MRKPADLAGNSLYNGRMYYVYTLLLANSARYVGRSDNLKRRIGEHKAGKVQSTKGRNPELIYYEGYYSKEDAIARELFLKTGDGRQQLKKQLQHTLMARSSSG